MARVFALDIENVKAEKKEGKIVLLRRRLTTSKQNHVNQKSAQVYYFIFTIFDNNLEM